MLKIDAIIPDTTDNGRISVNDSHNRVVVAWPTAKFTPYITPIIPNIRNTTV